MSSDDDDDNNKPLITISGQRSLVLSGQLSQAIVRDLPQEGVEWQRSYGRSSKIVYLEAKLVPFDDKYLAAEINDMQQLLSRPLLYTFWTDCSDLDTYKTQTRDEVSQWLAKMTSRGISDWFIVHLDNGSDKKSGAVGVINKTKLLPSIKTSSTVLDKLRNDFPLVKSNPDRTVSLLDTTIAGATGKTDSKTQESYQQFMCRLRSLLLSSYSRQLLRYEDFIRTQRESRNQPNWNFFHFFGLQEQLAFAFEMLSLYDEALVQYDELDALFSQFVINSNSGPIPEWLTRLSTNYDIWHGLCLSASVSKSLRRQFFTTTATVDGNDTTTTTTTSTHNKTLIELRNYLFARQSELLLLLNKPWELASRALPFLQNCFNELNILEITMTPGGMACWVFLSALEILHKCERYSDSSQMESYLRHTVGLWSYARNKLAELGTLCGLMPGQTMTSEHLHRVVNLIAGMGDDPRLGEVPPSPQERLKEALSGQESFLKHYMEISELTMGTYKHIGRMRFARLIGKELAELYIKMGKPQKAMSFLLDLEKVYVREKWPHLLNEIRVLLLKCYEMVGDSRRVFKVQCQLAANELIAGDQRLNYCLESERLLKTLQHQPNNNTNTGTNNNHNRHNSDLSMMSSSSSSSAVGPICIAMDELFEVQSMRLLALDGHYTVANRRLELSLELINNFPKDIHCDKVVITLIYEDLSSNMTTTANKHRSTTITGGGCPHMDEIIDVKSRNNLLKATANLKPEVETFHTSISVGVKCNNTGKLLIRRSDSHGFVLQDKEPMVPEYTDAFVATDVLLRPGVNDIRLKYSTKMTGTFQLDQIVLNWDANASIVGTDVRHHHQCFSVITEAPTLKVLQLTTLDGLTSDILCGVEQSIELQLNCGSSSFPARTPLTIRASHGLRLRLETDVTADDLRDEVTFVLPATLEPFQKYEIPLIIKSQLLPQKDDNSVRHELTMSWPALSVNNINNSPVGTNSRSPSVPTIRLVNVQFHLMPPFIVTHRLHTCECRKFVEIIVQCVSKRPIVVSEPRLTVPNDFADNDRLHLIAYVPKNDSCVVHHTQTVHYVWELVGQNPLDRTLVVANKLLFKLQYKLFDDPLAVNWQQFMFDLKFLTNYHTLYTIAANIEPQNGTEFCRAGALCHLNVAISRLQATDDHKSIMYEIVSDQTLWNVCGKTAGVVTIDGPQDKYEVRFDVMPLISGFLPYPTVRLSKYINRNTDSNNVATATAPVVQPPPPPPDQLMNGIGEAKLVAFDVGQVYNWSRATQVHVLPSSGLIVPEVQ